MYIAKVPSSNGELYYLRDRYKENGEVKQPYLYAYGHEPPTFHEPELINRRCEDALQTQPANSVDLIIDDPPYGSTETKWDEEPDWDQLTELYDRVLSDTGTLVIFGRQPSLIPAYQAFTNDGFEYRFEIVWKKHNNPWVSDQQPIPIHENIWVFSKKGVKAHDLAFNTEDIMRDGVFRCPSCEKEINRKAYTVPRGNSSKSPTQGEWQEEYEGNGTSKRYPVSVVEYRSVNGTHEEYMGHAGQKPTALLRWLIRAMSNRGDTVLDPHSGSASTMMACIPLCRRSIGIEVDRDRFLDAQERVNELIDDLSGKKHVSISRPVKAAMD